MATEEHRTVSGRTRRQQFAAVELRVLVWSRRLLTQGAVDDATFRFSTPEFLHIAVWAGKRNLTSFSNPARHQTDIMHCHTLQWMAWIHFKPTVLRRPVMIFWYSVLPLRVEQRD
jgi:hypothetical protein